LSSVDPKPRPRTKKEREDFLLLFLLANTMALRQQAMRQLYARLLAGSRSV